MNTVSPNYVTDCAQHFSFYLRLNLQHLKAPCVKLGSEKTSGFLRKMPLSSREASATPCFKKLSGALLIYIFYRDTGKNSHNTHVKFLLVAADD